MTIILPQRRPQRRPHHTTTRNQHQLDASNYHHDRHDERPPSHAVIVISTHPTTLFDWESGEIVRRTNDVEAKNVLVQSDLTFFLSRFSGLVPVRCSGHI